MSVASDDEGSTAGSPAPAFSWINFFLDAGIPETHSESYADVFEDNRITEAMLHDLTREILQEMGVAVMGDVIAILKHASELTAAKNKAVKAAAQAQQRADREAAVALKKERARRDSAGQRKRKSAGGGEELDAGSGEADSEGGEPALPAAKRASSGSARFYKDENGNTRPVRQVPRAYEGDYIVKLPAKAKGAATKSLSGGVFDRIGGGNKKGGANKAKASRPKIKSPGKGIFGRLGSGDPTVAPGSGGKRGKGRAVIIASQRQGSVHDRLGK